MGRISLDLEFDFDRSPLSACVRDEDGELVSHSVEAVETFAETLRQAGFSADVERGRIWNVARITISPNSPSGGDGTIADDG